LNLFPLLSFDTLPCPDCRIPVVYESSPGDSSSVALTNALVNALAIVGVIIGATFIMVALYYFAFMRVLFTWLILSTSLLLAFSTGLVVQTALQIWNVPTDALTYSIVFYNFAIAGIVAIFYGRGIPIPVTQGYLIVISVTMAWILIQFLPDWTTWALLALLAVYDLCAVLTPCGPLKWCAVFRIFPFFLRVDVGTNLPLDAIFQAGQYYEGARRSSSRAAVSSRRWKSTATNALAASREQHYSLTSSFVLSIISTTLGARNCGHGKQHPRIISSGYFGPGTRSNLSQSRK